MQPYSPRPGKRHNLFIIAFKHFPTGLLATAIGIAFLSAPLLYNLFLDNGFDSVIIRVGLTGAVIGIVPLIFLYLVTLLRSTKIRVRLEAEAQEELAMISSDLVALQEKEIKEEKEVIRLEQVVKGDIKARKVKDEKENERWDLLTESLRLQNQTVELASEERLLVAQQVKDIKEEGEVMRKGLASDDLEARHIKDIKEDKRWDSLNAQIRQQNATAELASEERLLVAQQVKDIKDEGEIMRKGLASDDLEARHAKDLKEDKRWDSLNERLRVQEVIGQQHIEEKEQREIARQEYASTQRLSIAQEIKDRKDERDIERKEIASDELQARIDKDTKDEIRWNALYERLRIQEERSEEREQRQILRDEEFVKMRTEDRLKDQYKTLFARFIRNSSDAILNNQVADGTAPIPQEWLRAQPEIIKNPSLEDLLATYNQR
ncbi:MAG: hypothetical protein Q8916_00440 [Bacteroidota bacterium]|nr:hypothetical protein [Bacteroidota bacterium]MDP4234923.1 hypothetical protein [Bacteroidota bacterium]